MKVLIRTIDVVKLYNELANQDYDPGVFGVECKPVDPAPAPAKGACLQCGHENEIQARG